MRWNKSVNINRDLKGPIRKAPLYERKSTPVTADANLKALQFLQRIISVVYDHDLTNRSKLMWQH